MYVFIEPEGFPPAPSIQQAGPGPRFVPTPASAATLPSTAEELTIIRSGPVDQLLGILADATGWRVEKTISLPVMPAAAVWAEKQSLSSIVQQINAQMEGTASVTLLPATKTIVLGAPRSRNASGFTENDQHAAIVRQAQKQVQPGTMHRLYRHGQGEPVSSKGAYANIMGAHPQAMLSNGVSNNLTHRLVPKHSLAMPYEQVNPVLKVYQKTDLDSGMPTIVGKAADAARPWSRGNLISASPQSGQLPKTN